MKISDGIKGIQFKGLIEYDFARGFNLLSEADFLQMENVSFYKKVKNGGHHICQLLISILTSAFISHYNKSDGSKIIFLLAPPGVQGRRKDIASLFHKISHLTEICDQLSFDYKYWKNVSIRRTFVLIYSIIIWYSQLHGTRLSLRKKIIVLHELSFLFDFQRLLKNLPLYKLALVFYDANLYNNFFVQYFKHKGIKTATLQHGVMVSSRPDVKNNLDFIGIEFKGSISDYFLAWNEFTKQEAIKSGIPEEKIKVLGVAKCIGQKPYIRTIKSQKTLGVLLDGIYSNINNEKMIKVIDDFCTRHEYQYILKYHPAYKGNEFDNSMSERGRSLPLNTTLEDLINQTDSIIVANSTALFELACLNVRFYRFRTERELDKFRDLRIPMFSSSEELEKIINMDWKEIKKAYDSEISVNQTPETLYRTFLLEHSL